MAQGARPDSAPARREWFRSPHRAGWHSAQTTHVQAAFSPDMAQGYKPTAVPLRPEVGWVVTPPEIDRFDSAMVQGSQPSKPRIFVAPRLEEPLTTHTHITAFSQEQTKGSRPDRFREFLAPKFAYAVVAPDVPQFSIEMVRGSRPDKPVLLLGARIPLPLSQTTHVQNAFTPSMVTGEGGQRFKQRLGPKTFGAPPPDVTIFSIEMAVGSRPDRPRLFLAPRFQQPPSQTTHVQAAFTPSMSQGYGPQRNREFLPVRIAWQVSQTTPVDYYSPEMGQGSQPLRNREWLPLKQGWISAQTTHTENAFSPDMVQGQVPQRPRLFLHPNPRLFRYHWGDELKTVAFVIADVVIDLSASAVSVQDIPASAIFVLDRHGSLISILDADASDIEVMDMDASDVDRIDLDGSEDE